MINVWQHYLEPLLNSNFFQTIITLLVGCIALYLYRRQHGDERRYAAQTIYNELISAESKLKDIRQRFFATQSPTLDSIVLFPSENWDRYKYMFVSDMSNAEWETIDSFYNNCKSYDNAVKQNSSYFHEDVKHIFDALYKHYNRIVIDNHGTNRSKTILSNAVAKSFDNFQTLYLDALQKKGGMYAPLKPVNDARAALVALDTSVSLSSGGQRLKLIAKIRD